MSSNCPILSDCELAWVQATAELGLVDSVTFKLKDGTTPAGGGPFACRVTKSRLAAVERQEGGKTVALELYDAYLPAGTNIQPFWRAVVTFADGSVIEYAVRDAGSPTTNEVLRKAVFERVR